jgi:hypothetical protein
MSTIDTMVDTIETTERLVDSIKEHAHLGEIALAQEYAALLVKMLNGEHLPCCLECGLALTEEEQDRYTSWCEYDAPMITIRFQEKTE